MSCKRFRNILIDYSEGSLRDGKRRAVESHLSACEVCSAELRRIETLKESIGSLGAPERDAEFWSRFDDKLARRIAEVETETALSRPSRQAWFPVAAAAAAALVVVSLVMFGGADNDGAAPGPKLAAESPEVPAAFEVDEVELALSELESLDDEMLDEMLLAQADLSDGDLDWDANDLLFLIAEDFAEASEEMVLEGAYEDSVYDFLDDLSEEELEEAYASLASI